MAEKVAFSGGWALEPAAYLLVLALVLVLVIVDAIFLSGERRLVAGAPHPPASLLGPLGIFIAEGTLF